MVFNKNIPFIGEFTKIPINLLFLQSFCVHRWRKDEKQPALQLFLFGVLVVNFLFNVTAMLLYLVFYSMETSLEKTAYLIYSIFTISALVKFASCYFNQKRLQQCLKNLQKCYPKTKQESIAFKLNENLKKINKYSLSLTIYHFGVTSIFNVSPLIQAIVLYWQDNHEFLYLLPFPMAYLFDAGKPAGYAVAYFFQCLGSYSLSCFYLGSDLLLVTCVYMINMNFKYLSKRILEYQPTGTKKDLKQLKAFIEYHNHILDTISVLDDSFTISTLINYIGTAMMICLMGFQLVAGTDFIDLVKFLSFLISALTHVFFISVCASEMMTLSCDIGDAFFHHSWYDGHIEYQRALILPIARAQRPAQLNAYKFFIISMETFKSLISISYQFFTLIKTQYDEGQTKQ